MNTLQYKLAENLCMSDQIWLRRRVSRAVLRPVLSCVPPVLCRVQGGECGGIGLRFRFCFFFIITKSCYMKFGTCSFRALACKTIIQLLELRSGDCFVWHCFFQISFRLCRKKKSFLVLHFTRQTIPSEVTQLPFLLGWRLMRHCLYCRNVRPCEVPAHWLRKVLVPPVWKLSLFQLAN